MDKAFIQWYLLYGVCDILNSFGLYKDYTKNRRFLFIPFCSPIVGELEKNDSFNLLRLTGCVFVDVWWNVVAMEV